MFLHGEILIVMFTFLAVVNMFFTIVAFIVFVHYLRQYNKGLKEYCELLGTPNDISTCVD